MYVTCLVYKVLWQQKCGKFPRKITFSLVFFSGFSYDSIRHWLSILIVSAMEPYQTVINNILSIVLFLSTSIIDLHNRKCTYKHCEVSFSNLWPLGSYILNTIRKEHHMQSKSQVISHRIDSKHHFLNSCVQLHIFAYSNIQNQMWCKFPCH